jgi:hypothetical protein
MLTSRSTRVVLCSLSLGVLASCGHGPPPPVDPALSPALAAEADAKAHASIPDGQRMGEVLTGVAYDRNQGDQWTVPLMAPQCYAFGYAADPGVSGLLLRLWSPSNKRVEYNHGRIEQGVVRHCATESGPYRLEARVTVGAGHFVIVAYGPGGAGLSAAPAVAVAQAQVAVPAPMVTVLPAAPLATPAPTPLTDVIDRLAASVAPGAARVGDFYNGIGDESTWSPDLQPGKCYSFIGAGDPGSVKTLSLYLWDQRSARITENRSQNEVSMVGYCAAAPGTYKLEAKVTRRSGPLGAYKVGVYAK